jgi:hypothetical protein
MNFVVNEKGWNIILLAILTIPCFCKQEEDVNREMCFWLSIIWITLCVAYLRFTNTWKFEYFNDLGEFTCDLQCVGVAIKRKDVLLEF